jgi:hypothetical protein
VAFRISEAPPYDTQYWELYDREGRILTRLYGEVIPRTRGFVSSSTNHSGTETLLTAASPEGVPEATLRFSHSSRSTLALAASPNSGIVVARTVETTEGWYLQLERYDSMLVQQGEPTVLSSGKGGVPILQLVVGIDQLANILVLWGSIFGEDTFQARWVQPDGVPATDEFAAFPRRGRSYLKLWPLIGGGLALQEVSGERQIRWPLVFPSAQPNTQPAPGWLESSPFLQIIRDNHGYASQRNQPAPVIVLSGVDGPVCGTFETGEMGVDGSLIRPIGIVAIPREPGDVNCYQRVYGALFQ